MQDAPKTEAQAAADAILAEYGPPTSDKTMRQMLAVAYSRGALKAATEAAEAVKSA
jgi:hypothetical protein